jgi:tetratricopeptide (TPR) repeat protein
MKSMRTNPGLMVLFLCLVSASVFAQDAAQLVTRAETAVENKDYDGALNDLNQAIALQKNNAKAYAVRGDVYMAQKKVELARLDYNQALKLSPKVSTFYYKRGMSFKETPGYSREASLADFNKALELDPTNEDALRERGLIYFVNENLPAAVTDFENALKLNKLDVPVYAYLARIHHKTNVDLALTDYNNYLAIKTDDPYTYVERGQIYESQSKADLALADYNKVIQLLPQDVIGYSNRADVYLRQKKYALGIDDLNKTIEFKPNASSGYSRRGLVYAVQGKYDLAIDDYHRALNLDSYNSLAKTRLPLAVEKLRAIIPTVSEFSALYNGYLQIFSEKAVTFNKQSAEMFALDEAQQKLPKPDSKMMCGKLSALSVSLDQAIAAFAPLLDLYEKGKMAGFTNQINMMERTIPLMETSKKGVKEYADYYRCQ